MTPDHRAFWEFSFDEMVKIDLPGVFVCVGGFVRMLCVWVNRCVWVVFVCLCVRVYVCMYVWVVCVGVCTCVCVGVSVFAGERG